MIPYDNNSGDETTLRTPVIHLIGIFEYYFGKSDSLTLRRYSLADQSFWPLVFGFTLAFLSLGVSSVTVFNTSLPEMFFLLGLGGFLAMVILHFLLVIVGSFYKRGVFKTVGFALLVVSALVVGGIAVGFLLFGGIFISAFIFLLVLPLDTIFLPINIIGFVGGSIWWYTKGLSMISKY